MTFMDPTTLSNSPETPDMPIESKNNGFLAIAYHLVENVDNLLTLVRLSQTSKLYNDLVNARPTIYKKLFDKLEFSSVTEIPSCCDTDCSCEYLRRQAELVGIHSSPRVSLLSDHWNVYYGAWFPCYGCRKFKRVEDFADHDFHQDRCFSIDGCRAHERRCAQCYPEVEPNYEAENAVHQYSPVTATLWTTSVTRLYGRRRYVPELTFQRRKYLRELFGSKRLDPNDISQEAQDVERLLWMLSQCEQDGLL